MSIVAVAAGMLCLGCRSGQPADAPPDASRPQLRSESELASERQARLQSGQVVENEPPTLTTTQQAAAAAVGPPADPKPGAVVGDILLVNDKVLSVPEILYPLRHAVDAARGAYQGRELLHELERMIRSATQQEVGSILLYEKALAGLNEEQRKSLSDNVEQELKSQIAREYGGSEARFVEHLQRFGLTREQYKTLIERQLLVMSYTRDILRPRVSVRRDDLIDYYEQNRERFATPETRELFMMEFPFAAFLPAGDSWERATPQARAYAKLAAMRTARQAHEALKSKPFEVVAMEFSRGVHAASGGLWGTIGEPLNPPYDELSRLVFALPAGRTSEPIETEQGWYIVRCGRIEAAQRPNFSELQTRLRAEVENQRLGKMATDYVLNLADRATIGTFELFIAQATRRALASDWPRDERTAAPAAAAN